MIDAADRFRNFKREKAETGPCRGARRRPPERALPGGKPGRRVGSKLTSGRNRRLNSGHAGCYGGAAEGGRTSKPEPRSGRLAAALVVVCLLVLLATVTLVASGGRPFGADDSPSRRPSGETYDYLFTVALSIAVVAVGVTLYLIRPPERFRRDRKAGLGLGWSLVALAVAVAFAIGVLLAARGRDDSQRLQPVTSPPKPGRRAELRRDQPAAGRTPKFEWPVALAAGAGVLLAATGAVAVARRRRAPLARADEDQLAEELASLLDDTLDDLRAEPDPRRAVVAAYARMERAFATYGIPRRPFEAPHEYLHRLTPALGDGLRAAGRLASELTHLYERAKFSAQEIDSGMKTDAIHALEALRSELRPAAEAVA